MQVQNRSWSTKICCGTVAVWLLAVAVGLASMDRAALVAGGVGPIRGQWPQHVALDLDTTRPNLLIFAHPLCPCTRATLHELQALLARTEVPINVRICFFEPSHPNADWQRGPLWEIAAHIAGATVQTDLDGNLAEAFGAKTSGWAVLYDARGQLRFAGGLTAARGHEGANDGVETVAHILQGDAVTIARTPVYGCALPSRSLASTAGDVQP